MSNVYKSSHPLIAHKLTKLREVATKPKKFRELTREIAALLTYEATKDLEITLKSITTPLTEMEGVEVKEKIGLVPILRAGLGMVEGVWGLVPNAEVWHIGLYRDEETLQPVEYYNKLPVDPTVGLVLVLDPMLATGGSACATVNILKKWGVARIKFVSILSAPEGIKALQDQFPEVDIYTAAIDSHLNEIGYIVPGLGDAGDRQFGTA